MSNTLNRTIEHVAQLVHYPIEPHDEQDLPAALNLATPNGNYHASAHWNISWTYNYQVRNGQCQIQSAQVSLNTQMLMPKIDIGYDTASQTSAPFTEYYNNLISHEYGHLDFGVLAANHIENLLLDKTIMDHCDDLGEASNARANDIIARYATADDEYDEDTDHGRTQGAYIYDLIKG